MEEWQLIRQKPDTKGRDTYEFLPKVSLNRLIGNREIVQVITAHGCFPAYLHRFKIWDTPLCACGDLGNWYHYLVHCKIHGLPRLRERTERNKLIWNKQVWDNKWVRAKVIKIMRWLQTNTETMLEYHQRNGSPAPPNDSSNDSWGTM